ncbi:proline/glycine betaine ABC transporter permease ProW, partial [Diaphorobacter sp. DS2]
MNDTTQETAAIDDPWAPADAAPAQAQAQASDPWAADTALQPADADPWGAG